MHRPWAHNKHCYQPDCRERELGHLLLHPPHLASKLPLGDTNLHPWNMGKPGLPPFASFTGLCPWRPVVCFPLSSQRMLFLTLSLVSIHPFPSPLSSRGHCFNRFLAIVPVYPQANTNQCELILLPLYTQTDSVNTILTLLVPVIACLGDFSYHSPPQASLGPRTEAKVLPSMLRPITIPPSSLSALSLACPGHSIHQALPLQDPQTPFLFTEHPSRVVLLIEMSSERCPYAPSLRSHYPVTLVYFLHRIYETLK